ncbi:MAG TPA: VOC family protein [Candidatus Binatia bacterium]|jgi:2,3-dihydroxybiphenyl 1,2-dioxygenase
MMAVSRLGYLGLEVSDVPAWERFAVDMLGLAVGERRTDGCVALRLDDQLQRIMLHPGPADDVAYVGFEVDDERALRELAIRLGEAGFQAEEAGADAARLRHTDRLYRVTDPGGVPIELFHGPERAATPFVSPLATSGFVTGDEGLGHVVLSAADPAATERFYRELLGMRLSDRVTAEVAPGFSITITFLHANPRHHTLAFAAAPLPKRLHHFMLEACAMEDVGHAYDRCLDAGVPIASGLGMHPNDRMFSFYAWTPSGFEVEYGWGGRKVDDATWQPTTYDRVSTWGHRPPAAAPAKGA